MGFDALLSLICNIEERNDVKTSTGFASAVWATKLSDVRFRKVQLKPYELFGLGTTISTPTYRLFFLAGTEITTKDRVNFNGIIYNILGVDYKYNEHNIHHIEVLAQIGVNA